MGKYDPFMDFLTSKRDSTIRLTFDAIEEILGELLPPSAHKYTAWWSNEVNGQHVQARSWLDAGWKIADVDIPNGLVSLIRFD